MRNPVNLLDNNRYRDQNGSDQMQKYTSATVKAGGSSLLQREASKQPYRSTSRQNGISVDQSVHELAVLSGDQSKGYLKAAANEAAVDSAAYKSAENVHQNETHAMNSREKLPQNAIENYSSGE